MAKFYRDYPITKIGAITMLADVIGTIALTEAGSRNATTGVLTYDDEAIKVGDVVILTPATSTVQAYIQKATDASSGGVAAIAANVDKLYVVAQSDQTLERGHVPVELRDHRYNPIVKATIASNSTPNTFTSTAKRISLYKVDDFNNLIIQSETADLLNASGN